MRVVKAAAGRMSGQHFVFALAAGLLALSIKSATDWQAAFRDVVFLALFPPLAMALKYVVPKEEPTRRTYRRRSRNRHSRSRPRRPGRTQRHRAPRKT